MDVDDPGNPEKNSGSVLDSKNVVRTFDLEKSKGKNILYVGSQALGFRWDHMEVLSPIKDGVVVDWDIVENIWDHAFRIAELMFEKYKVPALFLAKNAVLTSFASGRAISLVVDSGGGSTTIAPVHDDYVLQKAMQSLPIGGEFLTDCLMKSLESKGLTIKPRYSFKRKEIRPGEFQAFEQLDDDDTHFRSNLREDEVGEVGEEGEVGGIGEEDEIALNVSLHLMARGMSSKFDKYWGKFDKVNLLLFVVIVIDPCYKLNYIQWCVEEIYEVKHVDDLMMKLKNELTRLYDWYALNVQSGSVQTQTVGESSRAMDLDEEHDMDVRAKMKSKYKMRSEKQSNMVNKSELEKFLVDACEEDNDDFDILGWWKANSTKYRILSLIARDVLAILVSTVASESTFSTGGRVLDPFRSSLSPIMVEALICTQNWLRYPSQISLGDQLDKLEDIESLLMDGSSSKDVNIIDRC